MRISSFELSHLILRFEQEKDIAVEAGRSIWLASQAYCWNLCSAPN